MPRRFAVRVLVRVPLVAGLLFGSAGCGDDDAVTAPGSVPAPVTEAETVAKTRQARLVYGPDGELLPSDETFIGLVLPRGLELVAETRRMRRYETRAPLPKVLRYFGPRLVTGTVDRLGNGAVYRRATPKNVRGGAVPLDVSVFPSSAHEVVVVVIEEVPVTPAKTPSRETLEQLLKHGE